MAGSSILAPVEVVSFTKQRARRVKNTEVPFLTKWGLPSRFDFSPQPSDVAGPVVVPEDETQTPDPNTGFQAFWGSGEQVWIGQEVFRDASVALAGEAGLPVDAEGIQVTTFDLGERIFVHEDKHKVGDVTVIYPTIEHCREYLELEFSLTTVLSRGAAPPPDTPPPPKPPEIADAPLISETYDWSAPDFSGQAVVPMPPTTVPETVELGAFRTPIRFGAGSDILMLAFAWTQNAGGSGLMHFHFETPSLGSFGWGPTGDGITWPWPEEGKQVDYYDAALKGNFVITGGGQNGSGLWPIHVYLNLSAILTALTEPAPETLRVRLTARTFDTVTFDPGHMRFEAFKAPPLDALWNWEQNVMNDVAQFPATMADVWPRTAPDEWNAFKVREGQMSIPPIPSVATVGEFKNFGYLDINLATKVVTFTPMSN